MSPNDFLTRMAADVSKRCGICQATVKQVLPAVFDEIRYRLIEGTYPCVPIDSFGTFGVVNIPERRYHYNYKGADRWITKEPTKRLKFYAAYNLRKELERGEFDSTRRGFTRHPEDPIIRRRKEMKYQKRKNIYKGPTEKVVHTSE